jgi:hypothetical protein
MELSLFLARAWGLFILLVSLGLLINKKSFHVLLNKIQTDLTVLIAGIIALGIGVAQVVAYNVWAFNWEGLVTLIGWISLLKGILILFVPGYIEHFAKTATKDNTYTIAFIVGIIIGIYLLSVGFMS